jgi:hypothetical protein
MGLHFATVQTSPRVNPTPHQYAEHSDDADFTLLIDAKGIIAGASAGALQLLACAEEELVGTYYGVFFKTLHVQPEAADHSMGMRDDEDSSSRNDEDDTSCPLHIFGFVQRINGTRYPMEATIAFGRLGQEACGRPWNGAILTSKL